MSHVPSYASPIPAYMQIAEDLRAQISAGAYDSGGGKIPSNKALTEKYGVADGTIRQALEVLRAAGIVSTRSTRGTFVTGKAEAARPLPIRAPDEQLSEFRNGLRDLSERVAGYDDLKARVGLLEANLMDLYGRFGFDYPHGGERDTAKKAPRRGQAGR